MTRFLLVVVVLPAALAQTLVEYSLGAGRAAAAAPAAKSAGAATAATLGKLGKTMGQAAQAAKTTGRAPTVAEVKRAPKPLGPFADPAQITVGLERVEVLRQFGEPSMKIADVQAKALVETFWYKPPECEAVVVTLRDGKVSAVSAGPPANPQNTAVVIVQ